MHCFHERYIWRCICSQCWSKSSLLSLVKTFAILRYLIMAEDIVTTGDWKIPVLMIGFGMFLLFSRWEFHSRAINRIAKSAFAVYLITDFPLTRNLLWGHWFNLGELNQQPFAILRIFGVLIAIYVVCTVIDFVRQGVFALTFDRHPGRWFELLWNRVGCWVCAKYSEYSQTLDTHQGGSEKISPRHVSRP